MKHAWSFYQSPERSKASRMMGEPERRCANCGAVQQRETQTEWGRITGILWRPLAGRCSGALVAEASANPD